jgi:hypothetical protein
MVHVLSEHLSPVEEAAGNKKTEGCNDLANYSTPSVLGMAFYICLNAVSATDRGNIERRRRGGRTPDEFQGMWAVTEKGVCGTSVS